MWIWNQGPNCCFCKITRMNLLGVIASFFSYAFWWSGCWLQHIWHFCFSNWSLTNKPWRVKRVNWGLAVNFVKPQKFFSWSLHMKRKGRAKWKLLKSINLFVFPRIFFHFDIESSFFFTHRSCGSLTFFLLHGCLEPFSTLRGIESAKDGSKAYDICILCKYVVDYIWCCN